MQKRHNRNHNRSACVNNYSMPRNAQKPSSVSHIPLLDVYRVAELQRHKDERLQRVAADKERREAARASEFAEKQRARNAEREERDAAKAARDAARRVNKQPLDDWLVRLSSFAHRLLSSGWSNGRPVCVV